jgi:hypothetical protein
MDEYFEEEVKKFLENIKEVDVFTKNEINNFLNNIPLTELTAGFLKLIGELKEEVIVKNPLILDYIYDNLYEDYTNHSSKSIINIVPNSLYSQPISINKNQHFICEKLVFTPRKQILIWPIIIKNFEFISSLYIGDLKNHIEEKTSHFLKITISSLNIPIKKMKFNTLEIFINNYDSNIFLKDLFYKKPVINAYIINSRNEKLNNFSSDLIKKSKIVLNTDNYSHGIKIIEDFYKNPEIYQSVKIENIDLTHIFDDMDIYIPINLTKKYNISLYLWTLLVENVFFSQTEPFKISLENQKQILKINSSNENVDILKVLNLFIINKNNKISISNENNKNWTFIKEKENVYLVFNNIENIVNKWAYGEVLAYNKEAVNNINLNSKIEFIQNLECNFLTVPYYKNTEISKNLVIKYLNTDYKHLLLNKDLFKKIINDLLSIFNKQLFILIEEINILDLVDCKRFNNQFIAIKGKEIILTLKTNMEDPFLFGEVFHKFLVDFSSMNLFINLKIKWNEYIYEIKEKI